MAILQALLAALLRSMGSILNTAFGWATLTLFGRSPRRRQMVLSIVSFGSVLWLIAALGAIRPSIASYLLVFVTIPEFLRGWMRALMILLTATIPLVVGIALHSIEDDEPSRRGTRARLAALLRGYPVTMGFGVTFILLLVLVPLGKLRDAARGWATTHIPVIVEPQDYRAVVGVIRESLRAHGIPVQTERLSWVLRLPTRVLAFFAHRTLPGLVVDDMKALRADGLELLLHPSDLVVRGVPERTATAAAVLLECLIYTKAHLTWDEEGQALEERLHSILREMTSPSKAASPSSTVNRLRRVEGDLRRTHLPYEEIEKLFRLKLQVETEVLRAARASLV